MAISAEDRGTPFGRYRLLDRLGEGGMAVVYRAVAEGPEGFRRSLVIKRVRPALSSEPEFARMLAAEARVLALLNHPNIVQVYEFGEIDGEQYLTMEFVDGIDLGVLLHKSSALGQPIPPGLCCLIVSSVAAALAYAHDLRDGGRPLSIIHRDVSPSNIMVTRTGAVKLLDFGIAKATATLRHEQTVTGVFRGKLGYMSPQHASSLPIDRRADIFALGAVFYEILEGRRLFRGRDDLETINLVREAVVPPLTLAAELPGIEEILRRMLARDAEQRYSHCDQVVAALAPLVHERQGDEASLRRFVERTEAQHRAREPTGESTPQAVADREGPSPFRTPSLHPAPRGRRTLIAIAVGLMLALGGTAARRLSYTPAAPTPPPPLVQPSREPSRLDPPPLEPVPLPPESPPRVGHAVEPGPGERPHKPHPSRHPPRAKPSDPGAPAPRRDDELRPF
jgi:serine/threonine-protein kinase